LPTENGEIINYSKPSKLSRLRNLINLFNK
jgi:hypothetical protein